MSSSKDQIAVHREPIWRDRSDFIVAASIDPGDTNISREQLWVRKVGDRQFEICCIPFFVYDLALGDVVETNEGLVVERLISHSGHYTFRVAFTQSLQWRDEIENELKALGALLEWSSPKLLAVDASDFTQAQRIADFLAERENLGTIHYETGRRA